jgi:hypothetical protein
MNLVRLSTLLAVFALVGCGGNEALTPSDADPKIEDPNAGVDDAPKFDFKQEAENIALVPSPVETQKALTAAGIDAKLADLIPSRDLNMALTDTDHAAVRTGVVLADMLLTVKTAEKSDLLAYISRVRVGMSQLEGGKDIDKMLRDIEERVKADSVTRDELLREFDELAGAVIPELEFNGKNRVVPLIEAGTWLEGANLVARAVEASGNAAAGDSLLKQPAVVAYFIKYVKVEGAEKAPAVITQQLETSLNTLKGLAEKTEPFNDEDIAKVIEVTNGVLELL